METRICICCSKEKPVEKFSNYVNRKTDKRYYKNVCMHCKSRKADLKRKYGLSMEEYSRVNIEQQGKCKICDSDTNAHSRNNNLDVDHCHITGKIRGLLCNKCNKAIGYFNDDIELITKALNYLINNSN